MLEDRVASFMFHVSGFKVQGSSCGEESWRHKEGCGGWGKIDTRCVVQDTLFGESLLEKGYLCGALRKNERQFRLPAAALD
jgi:sarcosine oxidase delta subunit